MRKTVFMLSFLGLTLSSCTDIKYEMQDMPPELSLEQRRVWPPPPEKPRYAFIGELTGMRNFKVAEGQEGPQGAEKALMWIAGVDPATGFRRRGVEGVLQRPQTGAVDEMGRVFVTDSSRSAVFLFDNIKGTLRVWTEAEAGLSFSSPVGIAMGRPGEVLVTDAELGLVFRLSREGRPLSSFGHGLLTRPTGLARDGKNGLVYVADTRGHDIKVFDDNGEFIRLIGGPGEGEGEFNAPTHLAFSRDKLYVTDTLNARVQVFDQDGRFLRMLGKRGNFVGNLVRPKGVAADIDGNIYVVESLHDHLLVYDARGEFLLPIGGTGKEVGSFYLPSGIWTDRGKKIFVSDMFNGRVMMFQYLGGG